MTDREDEFFLDDDAVGLPAASSTSPAVPEPGPASSVRDSSVEASSISAASVDPGQVGVDPGQVGAASAAEPRPSVARSSLDPTRLGPTPEQFSYYGPSTGPQAVNLSRARLSSEERVLGGRRRLRAREVATQAGVSVMSARRFWRALGLPTVPDDAVAFTETDAGALRTVSSLVREGIIDDTTAMGLTRAIGRSVDRLASWQVQILGESVTENLGDMVASRQTAELSELAGLLADEFEPLITYAWRRHLASAMRRWVSETLEDPSVPTTRRSVAFADLVSFTRVVRELSERDLALLVQRFETITSDAVHAGGGRLIKTVGDEVLYVAWPPRAAAEIAVTIVDRIAADPRLPEVRIGIASGEVLARLGDVFGTTVNLASRMTTLASPGSILCDDATARELADCDTLITTPARRRTMKGLGTVATFAVTRPGEQAPVAGRWRRALGRG